jgi:hypothetical protein
MIAVKKKLLRNLWLLVFFFCYQSVPGQSQNDTTYSFTMLQDVKVTINAPAKKNAEKTILILYALPNGNTTGQTMGKKIKEGDDWHFDIQHIHAQTKFIRRRLHNTSVIVAYLENSFMSWPLWKSKHPDHSVIVKHIVDTLYDMVLSQNKVVYLNSHSGGGRFIFSYLDGFESIPSYIKRITFLDSNYGYDSAYLPKLVSWIKNDKSHYLKVFAYNDSVALYNGKSFVSATGGTWYRSHLMLAQLSSFFKFKNTENDSLIVFKTKDQRIQFYFKTNPDRKIYHTTQVELNGFIHSVLCGTKYDSKGYRYFGRRAYADLIQ